MITFLRAAVTFIGSDWRLTGERPPLVRVRATDGRTDSGGERRRYKKQSEREKKNSEKGRGIEQRQGQRRTAQ